MVFMYLYFNYNITFSYLEEKDMAKTDRGVIEDLFPANVLKLCNEQIVPCSELNTPQKCNACAKDRPNDCSFLRQRRYIFFVYLFFKICHKFKNCWIALKTLITHSTHMFLSLTEFKQNPFRTVGVNRLWKSAPFQH